MCSQSPRSNAGDQYSAQCRLYYLLHSVAIMLAVAIGGLLWTLSPQMLFVIARTFGIVATFILIVTVRTVSELIRQVKGA